MYDRLYPGDETVKMLKLYRTLPTKTVLRKRASSSHSQDQKCESHRQRRCDSCTPVAASNRGRKCSHDRRELHRQWQCHLHSPTTIPIKPTRARQVKRPFVLKFFKFDLFSSFAQFQNCIYVAEQLAFLMGALEKHARAYSCSLGVCEVDTVAN